MLAAAGGLRARMICLQKIPLRASSAVASAPVNASTVPDHPELQIPVAIRERAYPKIGNRDVVGYGFNGYPHYVDWIDVPVPGVRFGENTPEIMKLKQKELQSWASLSIDEKKQLYRHTFCRTLEEVNTPTGEWRSHLAVLFFIFGSAFIFINIYATRYWGGFGGEGSMISPTITDPERKAMTLKRVIHGGYTDMWGPGSKYDFEKDEWKK